MVQGPTTSPLNLPGLTSFTINNLDFSDSQRLTFPFHIPEKKKILKIMPFSFLILHYVILQTLTTTKSFNSI